VSRLPRWAANQKARESERRRMLDAIDDARRGVFTDFVMITSYVQYSSAGSLERNYRIDPETYHKWVEEAAKSKKGGK